MIEILLGVIAGAVSVLARAVNAHNFSFSWNNPILILGIAAVAMLIQKFFIERSSGHVDYSGIGDFFVHIHVTGVLQAAWKWAVRGIISLALNLFGGIVGIEGAATELTQASSMVLQSRSSRWHEQLRRTGVATAISAGIAAAFGSPLAAIVAVMEMGTGGRILSAVVASLTAYLTANFLGAWLHLPAFSWLGELNDRLHGAQFTVEFLNWRVLVLVPVLFGLAWLLSTGIIFFIRYCEESLQELFRTKSWMRIMTGGILIFMVIMVNRSGHMSYPDLMGNSLLGHFSLAREGLFLLTHILTLALAVAGFGSAGIFWPLFVLGLVSGSTFFHLGEGLLTLPPGMVEQLRLIVAFLGGSVFFGVILGAPIAGAILAFEFTHSPIIFVTCLIGGVLAKKLRTRTFPKSLIDKELEARGVTLIEGRAATILNSLAVRDAMVADFDSIQEHEAIAELHSKLLKSKYPFLPVLNSQGAFLGMLTVDMIEDSWLKQGALSERSPLSRLFEAKDLLYRVGLKTPVIKADDRLSAASKHFIDSPCVPVVADDGRVLGLLFAHNVRLAYDREVARRSLAVQFGNHF